MEFVTQGARILTYNNIINVTPSKFHIIVNDLLLFFLSFLMYSFCLYIFLFSQSFTFYLFVSYPQVFEALYVCKLPLLMFSANLYVPINILYALVDCIS